MHGYWEEQSLVMDSPLSLPLSLFVATLLLNCGSRIGAQEWTLTTAPGTNSVSVASSANGIRDAACQFLESSGLRNLRKCYRCLDCTAE